MVAQEACWHAQGSKDAVLAGGGAQPADVWGEAAAPTEPLPWAHFTRMPKRLKGGRHHGVHVSSDMELPNVYTGDPRSLMRLQPAPAALVAPQLSVRTLDTKAQMAMEQGEMDEAKRS